MIPVRHRCRTGPPALRGRGVGGILPSMPRTVVMKFGGTSVGDSSRVRRAAARAVDARKAGDRVVMVVSARGKKTDELVRLAGEFGVDPPARELDMLLATGEQESVALMAMALREAGAEAVSLTGGQIGIATDDTFGKARIRAIRTDRLTEHLDAGRVVVAAGFQGVSERGDITTLGRGGSDLTAAALAAVLGADRCEIYTDVPGVFTTDPRIEPAARKLDRIAYDEMLELASLGAGVMHSRSIEFAGKYGVPVVVRSSLTDEPGTLVTRAGAAGAAPDVTGLALVRDAARVTLAGLPDRPGVMADVFRRMADRAIPLDMVVQDLSVAGVAEVSFTVPQEDLAGALAAGQAAVKKLGQGEVGVGTDLAKISAVGAGMRERPGVAARMFRTLAGIGCNVELVTTSEIKVSCLIARDRADEAVRAVHAAFDLGAEPAGSAATADEPLSAEERRVRTVVEGLRGMEDIVVADVLLDRDQARLSVRPVPDRPGVLADLFEAVAGESVRESTGDNRESGGETAAAATVDMIVQNVSHSGHAAISFTVPQSEAPLAAALAAAPAARWGEGEIQTDAAVAKLTVSGVGLRSHTGVGLKLFGALAEAGVNAQLIGTSEMRVSVIVAAAEADAAVAAVRTAFGLD